MNVTALFVELLIIGIGTATWLALLLAAILKYKFDTTILTDNIVADAERMKKES
jgi:hypothetical protein